MKWEEGQLLELVKNPEKHAFSVALAGERVDGGGWGEFVGDEAYRRLRVDARWILISPVQQTVIMQELVWGPVKRDWGRPTHALIFSPLIEVPVALCELFPDAANGFIDRPFIKAGNKVTLPPGTLFF